MTHATSFRDLLDASDGLLRSIVAGAGDAPERVWAAWSLAIRRDPASAEAVRALSSDPSPGVRAHMALLLVANGERDAALALAQGDPAPIVRASAWRHLARSGQPDDEWLRRALVSGMKNDRDPAVHAAIADAIRIDAPQELWAACESRLQDDDDDVRQNVAQAALRRHASGAPLPQTMKMCVTQEKLQDLRTTMLRAWVAADGWRCVLESISTRAVDEVIRALGDLAQEGGAVPDGALEPMLARDIPAIDAQVGHLVRSHRVTLGVASLLRLVLRWNACSRTKWTQDLGWRAGAMQDAVAELAAVLPGHDRYATTEERALGTQLLDALEPEAQRVSGLLRVSLDRLLSYARGELADAEFWGRFDEDDSWIDWQPALRLIPDLRRLASAPTTAT